MPDLYDQAAVSTHSRLKAAGGELKKFRRIKTVSTHSRLKAAGRKTARTIRHCKAFQHTAA